MAIHARTTFAQAPEVATQVGFVVEGWTYVERVLRDVIIYASPPRTSEDLVASRLFHMGDLSREIAEARSYLDGDSSETAEHLRDLLDRFKALLPERNMIIHGWFAGPSGRFGVELHHYQRLPRGADRTAMSADDLRKHKRYVGNAPEFLGAHLTALSALIHEAVGLLHPGVIERSPPPE